jgi:ammonium transporter, Amt family
MNSIDSGDTAWLIVATALVLVMTPALAFFYGGMVRKKNLLSTLNLSFIMMGMISIQWVLFGYTISFGNSIGGFVGSLKFAGLSGVGSAPAAGYATTVPLLGFATYQMMFAIITVALITGAFVERVKFKAFLIFALLWATLVYDPVAHWVWGVGGWIRDMGALDFAGGTVVHVLAGFSALAFAMVIGQRKGYRTYSMEPVSIPYTVLGAGLLWMGWFGFNGGSAFGANGLAFTAIINTNTAAAAACLVWMTLSWRVDGKPSVLGIATGAIVGLVAITPAAGYVAPWAAIVIGGVASLISYYTIRFRQRSKLDESLDVFACHGLGGAWGALATGLFATTSVNAAGANGLFYGNPGQLLIQAAAVGAAIAFSFLLTFVIAKVLNWTVGLRVSELEEEVGLDISEHGERAFAA